MPRYEIRGGGLVIGISQKCHIGRDTYEAPNVRLKINNHLENIVSVSSSG